MMLGNASSSTEDVELCEIEVSKDGAFHMKPQEEAKVRVNGSEVKGRIQLFHEDRIQLEEARLRFVLNLPDWRRPSSCPVFRESFGNLDSDQDANIVLLSSKARVELDWTANFSRVLSHYDILDATSRIGLCPSGGVTFQPQTTSPRCLSTRKVGVFFWDADTEVCWLIHQLVSKTSVTCLALSQASDQLWKSVSSGCSIIIFCHSMRSRRSWYDMEGYLDHCLQSHGCEKTLVVISDLEDAMCEKGMRAQWRQSRFYECRLLLFTETEMNLLIQQRQMAESHVMEAKLNQIRCILQERLTDIRPSSRYIFKSHRKHIIGIFSKSTKNCFIWLKNLFTSAEKFKNLVQEVRLFHSVNVKDQKVLLSACTFMILYHSKKHGEAKITDVSGAFYEEELQYLSDTVGKENVVVVIDDMEKSRSAEKTKILQAQPSIQRLARDLFLFSVKENEDGKMEGQKMMEKLDTFTALITVKEPKTPQVQDEMKIRTGEATDRQDGHSPPRQKHETKPPRPPPSMEALRQKQNDKYHQVGCDREDRETHPGPHKPIPEIIQERISSPGQQKGLSSRHVVGIFSRSPQREYYWLRDILQSYIGQVQEVRHGYILESGSVRWMQLVTECTLGILYHNKKTGKLLITDVPGALYDKELRYLSRHLGRLNVFVVVDDAEGSSSKKSRILEKQPSVKKLSRGLEIFGRDKAGLLESPQVEEIIKLLYTCPAD